MQTSPLFHRCAFNFFFFSFSREPQECLFYTGDIADDQYYCSAVCDPSPCDDDEECSLTAVGCSPGSICGNGYVCSPADDDSVEVAQDAIVQDCSDCGEFQVRKCVCVRAYVRACSFFFVGPSRSVSFACTPR